MLPHSDRPAPVKLEGFVELGGSLPDVAIEVAECGSRQWGEARPALVAVRPRGNNRPRKPGAGEIPGRQ